MRFAIIGTMLATVLSVSGAYAQVSGGQMNISGTKEFCSVNSGKANCNFDTAAACQVEIKGLGVEGKDVSCTERSKLRQ
jgi:hypothetical protein